MKSIPIPIVSNVPVSKAANGNIVSPTPSS